ncbi:protein JASON-like isoform X2 [Typha latifolia]|uniref:protein JASON-like isoform X2 n=1 Tax=Typha latifolia TaxID=4733 RepID=UPI003C30D82D
MKRSKFRVVNKVLGFLESVLMGCFFACFRTKDDDRRNNHYCNNLASCDDRDPLVSKNQLGSLFLGEEEDLRENGSPCGKMQKRNIADKYDNDYIDEDLKREAKYLKSCGAISETPAEIWKASFRTTVQSTSEVVLFLESHSLLRSASSRKPHSDPQCNEVSNTPPHLEETSKFQEKTSERVNFEGSEQAAGVESQVQPVNFDMSPSQNDTRIRALNSNDSPYPTPLVLTDEMQTPGTIYPVHLENPRSEKRAKIRTQYAYPVLKHIENLSQRKTIGGNSSSPGQLQCSRPDCQGKLQQIALHLVAKDSELSEILTSSSSNNKKRQHRGKICTEECFQVMSQQSVPEDMENREPDTPKIVISSLSHCLRPPTLEEHKEDLKNLIEESLHCSENSDTNRHIIGIFPANWNNDEPAHKFPKWWDGNGIPNSTTKYKEDQKVNWHATPFEERLEKALSDDKLFPRRKLLNRRLVELEEEGK